MWNVVSSKKKRIGSTLALLAVVGVLFLYNWTVEGERDAHVMPTVEKCDIRGLWSQGEKGTYIGQGENGFMEAVIGTGGTIAVSEDIKTLLSEQTGLSKKVVEDMLNQGRQEELYRIQEVYFAPVEYEALKTTPLTVSEWLTEDWLQETGGMPMVDLQDGDILITKNSRFLGWRNGHAALVVDAGEGLVLEAIMLGYPSKLCKVDKWEHYPSFLVLRLKGMESNIGVQVASYAKAHLVDVPYHLLADLFGRKGEFADEGVLAGTHCAHLVWYAYMQFGIDLDGDGGLVVTPHDIQNSPYLEIVQSYGY